MKHCHSFIILSGIIAILLISACAKTGSALFKGNYSFKTSGYVTAVVDSSCRFDTTITTKRKLDTLGVTYDTVWLDPVTKTIISRIDSSYIVEIKTYKDTTITENPDTIMVNIPTENGQMDITEIDGQSGKMVITMNTVGGDIIVYYATAEGNNIKIEPKKRHFILTTSVSGISNPGKETSSTRVESTVVVTGEGVKYDNIVLFKFLYDGFLSYNDIKYNIISSDIDSRAKLN